MNLVANFVCKSGNESTVAGSWRAASASEGQSSGISTDKITIVSYYQ